MTRPPTSRPTVSPSPARSFSGQRISTPGDYRYVVDSSSDSITENSSEGTDTIYSSATYITPDNVENLIITGSSNINATGNSLNNTLRGNSGNNTLSGGDGDDNDNTSYAYHMAKLNACIMPCWLD